MGQNVSCSTASQVRASSQNELVEVGGTTELSRSTWSTRLSPPSSSRLAAGVIEGLRTAHEQSRSPSRETTCNASFPSQKLAAGRSSSSYSTVPILENMVAERELKNSHDSL